MADNTKYRDPKVTTSADANDKSGGSPSWLKWVLIAIAVLVALWLLMSLLGADDEVTRVGDPDAVVVQPEGEVVTTETVPVVPVE